MSWLRLAIGAREPFTIGQLAVAPSDEGWEVRGPEGAGAPREIRSGDLRTFVRFDDSGGYRPLSGARSLPAGWKAVAPDDDALREVIESVYPLATRHIDMDGDGTLRTVGVVDVLKRQSGRYETAATLSLTGRERAVSLVCGECVREPAWNGNTRGANAIPCPEACSVLVSFCREAEQWERDEPLGHATEPGVGFADFASPGNALREAFLADRQP